MVYDFDGNLWIGINDFNIGEGGLIRFNGHNWDVYKPSRFGFSHDSVYSLDVDSHGNLYVGTADGLTKFDGSTWMILNPANSEIPSGGVISILVDDQDVGGDVLDDPGRGQQLGVAASTLRVHVQDLRRGQLPDVELADAKRVSARAARRDIERTVTEQM